MQILLVNYAGQRKCRHVAMEAYLEDDIWWNEMTEQLIEPTSDLE